ncbi:MAG: sugar phosphate nucleotidyltransferase [Actinomycetota bacterium]|nr:sugar phosphate nucleotidyltransferase [Actinomycetota bacterium]
MKAVVLAGGQGVRLRPLTSNNPKPMVPVVNRPMMEHIIELLKHYGFEEIVVTLQFLPNLITNYFDDGSAWGVDMKYVTEETPMGTAGSVRNGRSFLDGTFLVMSGDVVTDIDLEKAREFHHERKAMVTIVLKEVANPLDFGIVVTDENGRIKKFLEKPGWGEVFSDAVNTGIYIIEPEILNFIPEDRPYDFAKDLFPELLDKNIPIYGYIADGYWCDVGNLESYANAHRDILDGKARVNIPGHRLENNVWIGDGVEISEDAITQGPVVLGNHVRVEDGVKLREYSVLGDNVVVKRASFVHRSIIMQNSFIGPACHIRGGLIGRNCDVKSGVRIDEGATIGDECIIGQNAIINPHILIFPFKTIDPRLTVNSSIIWETHGTKPLFGRKGIYGLVNVDVTTEKAVRLGMAYGSTLPKGSQIVTSRNESRAARVIKRAFMCGLNASGVHVRDLEVNSIPVNRFTVSIYNNEGGVDFRTREDDPQWIEIQFFDQQGKDLDQKARREIETNYNRGDFRRAFVGELGGIFYPTRAREAYMRAHEEALDFEKVIEKQFKLVCDYSSGAASLMLPALFGKLGCEVLNLKAYTDEPRGLAAIKENKESVSQLARLVKSFEADFGLIVDNGAEYIEVIDDRGSYIDGMRLLLVMVDLVTRTFSPGKLAVPINQPSTIEEIAEKRGFSVLRTRVDPWSLMASTWEGDVCFAGNDEGGFIFPHFLPAFDGMLSTTKLLEMLAKTGDSLSSLAEKLPSCHLVEKDIYTSWEYKGKVMRTLLEANMGDEVDTTDGLKIFWERDKWVLVLPDQEEPAFHLYAQGKDEEECMEIITRYEDFIKKSST